MVVYVVIFGEDIAVKLIVVVFDIGR